MISDAVGMAEPDSGPELRFLISQDVWMGSRVWEVGRGVPGMGEEQ